MPTGPHRPGSLIPFQSEDTEPVRYNRRTQSVTDRDGNPLELRGDLGGDAATPPPGFQGMRRMRPAEVEARYHALLEDPGLHKGLAADPAVPLPIRSEAVDRLNDAEGSERYLLESGVLRDRVAEAREDRLLLADQAALELGAASGPGGTGRPGERPRLTGSAVTDAVYEPSNEPVEPADEVTVETVPGPRSSWLTETGARAVATVLPYLPLGLRIRLVMLIGRWFT